MTKKRQARKAPEGPIFISPAAEAKYAESIIHRQFGPERGFQFNSSRTLGYPAMIHTVVNTHKWRVFCSHPEAAIVPLVREFCANFEKPETPTVMVRGTPVPIGPSVINTYYQLAEVEDEFQVLRESVDRDFLRQVLTRLCGPDTEWQVSRQHAFTFVRSSLKPDAKLWYQFVQANMMPTTHNQTVSRERAILLYCILEGRRIDVGRLLFGELCTCVQAMTGTIWFPSLISGLCKDSGVSFEDTEELVTGGLGALTVRAVGRFIKEKMVQPPSEIPTAPGPEPSQGPPSTHPSSSSAGQSSGSADAVALLQQQVTKLQKKNRRLEGKVDDVLRILRTMQRTETSTRRYMQARDDALAKNLKFRSNRFFTFPTVPAEILESPPPTPPQSEDSSEEED